MNRNSTQNDNDLINTQKRVKPAIAIEKKRPNSLTLQCYSCTPFLWPGPEGKCIKTPQGYGNMGRTTIKQATPEPEQTESSQDEKT